jgi:hypothetical protein
VHALTKRQRPDTRQMNLHQVNQLMRATVFVVSITVASAATCAAQETRTTDQLPAPPPMRTIPEVERNQLNDLRDSKSRIKKTIEFADAHLVRSEAAANQQEFDQALRELGLYLGLLEDAFKFLAKLNSGDRGKSRDLYKNIELALRAHGPRLTVMRRATPLEYATRMKEAEDFAREGRTDALNAFYGHTVVRDGRAAKPEEKNKPKNNPPNPER